MIFSIKKKLTNVFQILAEFFSDMKSTLTLKEVC